jgi:hypothetical protein
MSRRIKAWCVVWKDATDKDIAKTVYPHPRFAIVLWFIAGPMKLPIRADATDKQVKSLFVRYRPKYEASVVGIEFEVKS